MVGCAMRTKMPTGRYLHGAHGTPYIDKTLNLLALSLSPIFLPPIFLNSLPVNVDYQTQKCTTSSSNDSFFIRYLHGKGLSLGIFSTLASPIKCRNLSSALIL